MRIINPKADNTRRTSLIYGFIWMIYGYGQLFQTQRVSNFLPFEFTGTIGLMLGVMLIIGALFLSTLPRVYFNLIAATWAGMLSVSFIFLWMGGGTTTWTGAAIWAMLALLHLDKVDHLWKERENHELKAEQKEVMEVIKEASEEGTEDE